MVHQPVDRRRLIGHAPDEQQAERVAELVVGDVHLPAEIQLQSMLNWRKQCVGPLGL